MAKAVDNTSYATGANAYSLTQEHICTGTGTDGILVITVQVTDTGDTDRVISTVTHNNEACTHLPSADSDDGIEKRTEIWIRNNPTTGGTPDIVVTPGDKCTDLSYGAVSYTGVNSTYTDDLIDTYDVANAAGTTTMRGTGNVVGISQSITGDGRNISSCVFHLKKTNSPTGNATATIYEHSGTFGSTSIPTGSVLATSDTFDVSTLTTTLTLTNFNFSGADQIVLTDGTKYCVAIEYADGDTSNYIEVSHDGTSPTHGGNKATLTSGSWTYDAVYDVIFYLYGGTETAIGTDSDPTLSIYTAGSSSYVVDSLSSGESGGTGKITAVHTTGDSPIHELDVGADFHAAQFVDAGTAGAQTMNWADTDEDTAWVMSAMSVQEVDTAVPYTFNATQQDLTLSLPQETVTTVKNNTFSVTASLTVTASIPTYGATGVSWYNASWGYRVKVTVQGSEIDADLTDFPVYADLSDLPAGFHTNVNQTDGRDIRVTTKDGATEIPREVVFYTSGTDTGELHFKASNLYAGLSEDFWVYYGNGAASDYADDATYGAENVWTAGYEAVLHLQEGGTTDANAYDDSSGKFPTGATGYNDVATNSSSQIETGTTFDGTGDYIDIGTNTITGTAAFTISAWINTDIVNDYSGAVSIGATGATNSAYIGTVGTAQIGTDNSIGGGFYGTNFGSGDTTTGSWKFVVMTFAGGASGDAKLYVSSGTPSVDTTYTPSLDATYTRIGRITSDVAYDFTGSIDEVRVLSVERTGTWISTEYNNQSNTATFYNVGAEEAGAGGTPYTFNATQQDLTLELPQETVTVVKNVTFTQTATLNTTTAVPTPYTVTPVKNITFNHAATLDITITLPQETVTTVKNVTASPSEQVITISLPQETVTSVRNVTTSPVQQDTTLSLPQETVTTIKNVTTSPAVQTVTASVPTYTVSITDTTAPAESSLTVTIPVYTVTAVKNIAFDAGVQDLTLSIPAYAVSIHDAVAPSESSLTLSIPTYTVSSNILLRDDFADNSFDTVKWTESTHAGSLVAEQNNQLELISAATTSAYIRSAIKYDVQNNQAILKVTQHCADGGFKLCPTDPAGHQWDVYSEEDWYNFQTSASGVLSPNKKVAGVGPTQIGGDSPSLTPPYWMRLRIDATTIYFDYSEQSEKPNSENDWTNVSSEAWSLTGGITATQYIFITAYNTPTSGEAQVQYCELADFPIYPNAEPRAAVQDLTLSIPAYSVSVDESVSPNEQIITVSIPSYTVAVGDGATPATQDLTLSIPTYIVTVDAGVPYTFDATEQILTLSIPAYSVSINDTTSPSEQIITASIPTYTVTTIKNVTVSPGVQTVTASLPSRTVAVGDGATPATQTVTVTIPAYIVHTSISIPASVQDVTLSLPAHTLNLGTSTSPTVQTVTLSIPAYTVTPVKNLTTSPAEQVVTSVYPTPSVSVSGGVDVQVAPAAQTVTASIPTYTVTAIKNVTASVGVQDIVVSVPAYTVSIADAVAPTESSLTVSIPTYTVTAIKNVTTSPAVQDLTLSIPIYTVTGNVNVTGTLQELTVSIPAYTVSIIEEVAPSESSLTVSIPAYTVTGDANITAAVQDVILSIPTYAVSISDEAAPTESSLTVSIPAYTVTPVKNVTASPAVQTITATIQAYVVSVSEELAPSESSLTVTIPTYTVTAVKNVIVSPSVQVLTLSIPVYSVGATIEISVGVLEITASIPVYAIHYDYTVFPRVLVIGPYDLIFDLDGNPYRRITKNFYLPL